MELSTGEHSLYNGIKIFGIHLFNFIAWLSGSSASVGSLENNSWLTPELWKLLELLLMGIYVIIF